MSWIEDRKVLLPHHPTLTSNSIVDIPVDNRSTITTTIIADTVEMVLASVGTRLVVGQRVVPNSVILAV
jgi:hypothetical protein